MQAAQFSSARITRRLGKSAALGALLLALAGCVVEPLPPPPMAAAPAPGYYGQPCCYAYPDYPPYYYYGGGPSVGLYYGYANHGYRHYRY